MSLLAVALLGVAAVQVAWSREDQHVDARRKQVVGDATRSVQESLTRTLSSMRGANGIAVDGKVTKSEFAAYAAAVVSGSLFKMLAHEEVIDGKDRAGFEATHGFPIVDLHGTEVVPAAGRGTYWPVVEVAPTDPLLPSVLGFDLGGEPIRAATLEAARQSGEPSLSAPVTLARSDRMGSFVAEPLIARDFSPDGQVIGFVTGALAADDLVDEARQNLPGGADLSLTDDGQLLTGETPPSDVVSSSISVGGRTFVVAVDGAAEPTRAWPMLIAAATLIIAALLVVLGRRERRYQRRRDRGSELNARLATAARRLSFAVEVDDVVTAVGDEVAAVVEASSAELWWVQGPRSIRLARPGDGMPHEAPDDETSRATTVAMGSDHPAARAARSGVPVTAPTTASYPLFDSVGDAIAVLSFTWAAPVELDPQTLSALETLARICGQTARRTRATRAANELAELASDLASAASESQVAKHLQSHLKATLEADEVAVLLSDPARQRLTPVTPDVLSSEPETLDGPLDPTGSPSARAFELNEAIWIASFEDLDRNDPQAPPTPRLPAPSSVAVLPVRNSSGRPIGVLSVSWRLGSSLDRSTRALLVTASNLAGQTFERVQLDERESRIARQAQAIAELGARLANTNTLDDAVAMLADQANEAADSQHSSVAIRDDDHLDVTHDREFDASLDARLGAQPISDDLPHGAAVLSGDLILLANRAEIEQRFPAVLPDLDAAGVHAIVHIPLRGVEGEVFGAIGLAWDSPQHFELGDAARFRTLGTEAARTLERIRLSRELHDAQRDVVLALQRQLLAPMVAIDAVELAAHYEPASAEIGMGGDWYDSVVLPDGSLVVVVGDVVGHGVGAVAMMAQLQHLVTGLLRGGTPLDAVFAAVDGMVGEDVLATAQLLHVDVGAARLGYANAGHPWALLRDPAGEVTVLDRSIGPPIGFRHSDGRPLTYVDLPPGSLVLSYTDGLIERRDENMVDSIHGLARALADVDAGASCAEILSRLVDRTSAGRDAGKVNDDVAAVLLRTIAPPPVD